MTSQPQPVPGETKSAGQYLRPLRDLAAYVLVGAAAVLLFVAIIRLIPGGANEFGLRTQDSFYGFVNLATITFPLGAVLLALLVSPRHPKAQLIVLVALVEYAVIAFFGLFFGLLIGLINHASNNGARIAFEELLVRVAWLAVLGVAAYAVFQIWRGMFQVVRPKPQPGMYGQPQYAPGGYPNQPPPPGYGPPPGFPPPGAAYPGQPQPQPHPGQPQPGQPQPGQPQQYGQPQPSPAWNQPAVPMPGQAQPGPFPPQPGNPPFGSPQNTPPAPAPAPAAQSNPAPFSEPTQVVPQHDPGAGADRTEKIGDDRPGFGPADQDPPRH